MKNNIDIEFLKVLVSKGYFPDELPPIFNTKNLSDISSELLKYSDNYKNEVKHSKALLYTVPRYKNTRRNLMIPNPHHQFQLSRIIVENWSDLSQFYKKSEISLTIPIIDASNKRAITRKEPFNEITRQSIIKSTASRYLLKTDISRYYSTIYTHSISWALHGKEEAKRKRNDKKMLGNLIDTYVRNTKEQQTIGIPIGPDTSLVISEILGTGIDEIIQEKIPDIKGFRYVDDIYLFFKNLGDAEEAKHILANAFNEFELEMNSDKTEIIELQDRIEPEWIAELRLHSFNENNESDLISYFGKVFKYADEFPKDKVIKYAIKRVKKLSINKKVFNIYQAFLMKSVLSDPLVFPDVIDIIKRFMKVEGYSINANMVEEAVNYLIEFNARYNNVYELLWGLWALKVFNLKLYEENLKLIEKVDDPLVALMVLYLEEVGFIEVNVDHAYWQKHMLSDGLYTDKWILVYEAYVRGWLPSVSGKDYIENKNFFRILREHKIRFMNIDVNHIYDEAGQEDYSSVYEEKGEYISYTYY